MEVRKRQTAKKTDHGKRRQSITNSFSNLVLVGKRERKRLEQILIVSSDHSDATSTE